MHRRRRIRLKKRFFVFVFAFALGLGCLLYSIIPSAQYAQVIWGTVTNGFQVQGVAVRNEKIIMAGNVGRIVYMVGEGQQVKQNTPVVQTYRLGFSPKNMDDLLSIQANIYDYAKNVLSANLSEPQLGRFDQTVETFKQNLSSAILQGNNDEVYQIDSQLRTELLSRRQYLDTRYADNENYRLLLSQEKQIKQQVTDFIYSVVSPNDGMISFFYDGCGVKMNLDSIKAMRAQDIQAVLKNQKQELSDTMRGKTALFRLIQEPKWCYAVMSNKKLDFTKRNVYDVVFEGYEDHAYQGKFIGMNQDGVERVYLFEILQSPGPLSTVREIAASIGDHYDGMKVPISAIRTQKGKTGVFLVDKTDRRYFIPVSVISQDKKQAIVEQQPGGNGLLEVGSKVLVGR